MGETPEKPKAATSKAHTLPGRTRSSLEHRVARRILRVLQHDRVVDAAALRLIDTDIPLNGFTFDPDLTDAIPGTEVARDELSGFKAGVRGKSELWIGGYTTDREPFKVTVGEIRLVRTTG